MYAHNFCWLLWQDANHILNISHTFPFIFAPKLKLFNLVNFFT